MFKRVNLYLISLLAITSIIFIRWALFKPSAGGDWHYYSPEALQVAFRHFVWDSSFNLGGVDLVIWRFPVDILKSFMGLLGMNSSISDKLIVFFPSVILGIISSFYLVKKVTNSDPAAFVGAVVFNFNIYFLTTNSSILIYGATSWVIFGLLSFMRSLETGKVKYSVLSSLLLFIAASYDFRISYIGIFLYFFYFLYYSYSIKKENTKRFFLIFLTSLFFFVLLNIYWIIPMLKLGSLTANSILGRTLFGNEFLNILYSISLYHPFWTGGIPVYFIPQQISSYFWLIPIIAFLGLYLGRKNKNVLFFGIIALLGIFLTKQIGIPFPKIYPWLFNYLPGFNAFREASKFYFLIAIGYSVLIGSFIRWAWKYKFKNKFYIKYILFIIISFLFFWNLKSILSGEINGIYVNRQIPNAYRNISVILDDSEYYRNIWIPSYPRWFFYSKQHPIVGFQDLIDDPWRKFAEPFLSDKVLPGETMKSLLNERYTNNLLDLSSIRYLVIPYSDPEADMNIFQYYGKDRSYYIKELEKLKFLHKTALGNKDLIIFENYDYKPHLYLTKKLVTIKNNDAQYQKINYKTVNSTEYRIFLKKVKKPFFLNFSETFHPQWKIRVGSFNKYRFLNNKEYFISDKNHYKNDASLNSFYINPTDLCKKYSCRKNQDGTYDINLTLYFNTQSYLSIGLFFSGTVVVVLLTYFFFKFVGRNNEKKN